jgi:hypothetical protein
MISSVNRNSPLPQSEWVTVKAPGVSNAGSGNLKAPNLHKVTRAAELQGPAIDKHPQRHADAEPDIFLQTRRSRETLRGVDDLGKSVAAPINASPDLATGRSIFGYRDNAWDIGVTTSRQRAPDQSRQLRQPPSDPAEPDLDDLADINGGLAIRQTLREPPPGGQRQPPPVLVGQQGAKSEITSGGVETLVGSRWRSKFRDFAL